MNILQIKQDLQAHGFGLELHTTGVLADAWGPSCIEAVKAFQRAEGLEADGIVGIETLNRLYGPEATLITSASALKPYAFENGLSLPELAKRIAVSQNGVKEATGKNDGGAVEAYLKSVNLGKGYSWCMAFVYWCYNQAAWKLGVKNPLKKTAGVLDQWNSMGLDLHYTEPKENDIMIMDFGGGEGHTGIVTAVKSGSVIETVEGNTNNNGSRNGDGVYYPKTRALNHLIKGFIRIQ